MVLSWPSSFFSLWTTLLVFVSFVGVGVALVPGSADWAQQGFYFDWNNASSPLPTPITAQCENIHIKWNRGAGVGPDPSAPYILKLYTSSYQTSFVIDAGSELSTTLAIPLDPGSQYVMCMTDSESISGGCQDLYTVYPSGNTLCQNLTLPARTLGVKMTSVDTGGTLSRIGWPASCSDLQFDLVDGFGGGIAGTPPYTLTVAPAFRTPVNVTFQSTFVRWTVVLDHGHPFFVSITDSQGVSWVNGPLHGGAGSLECFGESTPHTWLTLGVSLGMSFSFLVLGMLLSALGTWYLMKRRSIRFSPGSSEVDDKTTIPYHTSTRDSQLKSISSRADERRISRTRTGGSGSVTTSPQAATFLSGLHLRRPSNNRAGTSEALLMQDRPGFRREQTNGTPDFDLAASPAEERARHAPFATGEEEYGSRRPSAAGLPSNYNNEDIIIPWTGTGPANAAATTGQDVRHPTATIVQKPLPPHISSPPDLKRGRGSTSSGGSPTTAGAANNPEGRQSQQTRNSFIVGSLDQLPPSPPGPPPPRPDSVPVPIVSSTRIHGHQNSFSSGHIVRSQSHSSTITPSNHAAFGTPSTPPHQQQQHEVYVVHHDAGLAPPVTVFTRPGTVVTELPPGYDNLIPTPRRSLEHISDAPNHQENTQPYPVKQGPTTSNSAPALERRPISTLQVESSGLALVHAEDVPLSAVTTVPGSTFLLADSAPTFPNPPIP